MLEQFQNHNQHRNKRNELSFLFDQLRAAQFLNTEQSPPCLHIFHVTLFQNNEKQSSLYPSEFAHIPVWLLLKSAYRLFQSFLLFKLIKRMKKNLTICKTAASAALWIAPWGPGLVNSCPEVKTAPSVLGKSNVSKHYWGPAYP